MNDFEEKVLSSLKNIDEKLNKLLGVKGSETESKTLTTPVVHSVKPSAIVEKQEEEEKVKEKPPVEGRRVCPACGGTDFNAEEDKSQVLFQQGGMKLYAKRYICKSCGAEV